MELTRRRQPVAAVVAPPTDDERMETRIAREHQSAHPQRRPLHEHGTRNPDILDRRPVELAYLGRCEHFGTLLERMERSQESRPCSAFPV